MILTKLKRAAQKYGMTRLSKVTGIDRVHLYETLGPNGNPQLKTLLKICAVLGARLEIILAGSTNISD